MDVELLTAHVRGTQVHRNPFDRTKLGRNAYANLYQFQGQLAYLRTLQQVRRSA